MDKTPHLIRLADESLRIADMMQTRSVAAITADVLAFPDQWPAVCEDAELDNKMLHSPSGLRVAKTVKRLTSGPGYAYTVTTCPDRWTKVVWVHDGRVHPPKMHSPLTGQTMRDMGYTPIQLRAAHDATNPNYYTWKSVALAQVRELVFESLLHVYRVRGEKGEIKTVEKGVHA
jgi:hypothetical protein